MGGEKYEAGLKKRGDALSAFLLAAKLRINVSRSIQRLAAPSRTAPCGEAYPLRKKKKIHRCVPENSSHIAQSTPRNIPGGSWFASTKKLHVSRSDSISRFIKKRRWKCNLPIYILYFSDRENIALLQKLKFSHHAPRAIMRVHASTCTHTLLRRVEL